MPARVRPRCPPGGRATPSRSCRRAAPAPPRRLPAAPVGRRPGARWAVAAAAIAAIAATPARAEPTRVQVEAGAEYDTNVHRIERRAGEDVAVQAAPLVRVGARVRGGVRPRASHRLSYDLFAGAKRFFGDARDDAGRTPSDEDVAIVAARGAYAAALASRRAIVRAVGSYYDAIGDDRVDTARNFRSFDARGELVLVGPERHRFALHAGLRAFTFKPDGVFDYRADHYGARYTTEMWRSDSAGEADASSVEVAAAYRLERRDYAGAALTDACDPPCPAPSLGRVDLFHVASIEVTYTGDRVYAARYELQVDDSNSFGQSLVRHRVDAAVTTDVAFGVSATAKLTVLYNVFVDGLLVARDVNAQTGVSIEDENRNGLVVHLARPLAGGWTAEARYGLWSNEFATDALRFRRQAVYAGLLYER
ncbi:MAG: hypothetical protein D6689_21505 [Deltaproteobacteria bacterium]|nr:MAG: hypothetical protein D6689_21505 [Deltaproteobacteria bacterium]